MIALYIVAGIYVTSRVINRLFNRLSEYEVRQKEELATRISKIDEDIVGADNAEIKGYKILKHTILLEYATNRIEECKLVDDDIEKTLNTIIALLDDKTQKVFLTPIRRNSLQTLQRQITEAKYKNIGYINYLKLYRDRLARCDDPVQFDYRIPAKFPYYGKIIWVTASQVSEGRVKDKLVEGIDFSILINDYESEQIDVNSRFPIMVTDRRNNGADFNGSIAYGSFQEFELSNGTLGIKANVKEYKKSGIELLYKERIKLFLPYSKMKSYNRYPLVRQDIIVYPFRWIYGINCYDSCISAATVSERDEDRCIDQGFSVFPVLFEKKDISTFMDYLKKEGLINSEEEWLIGPLNQNEVQETDDMIFKLQIGRKTLCSLKLDLINREEHTFLFFKYLSLIEDSPFEVEDVYVPVDSAIAPCYEDTDFDLMCDEYGVQNIDVYDSFARKVLAEINVQFRIKRNVRGLSYFVRWENIIDSLIQSSHDECVDLMILWEKTTFNEARILNLDDIFDLIDKKVVNDSTKLKWYIVDKKDREISVVVDGNKLIIVDERVNSDYLVKLRSLDCIKVYLRENHYVEMRQKEALQQLRMGDIVNPAISLACLNAKEVSSCLLRESEIIHFKNLKLGHNKSQRDAVIRAFSEKNVFAIQGPPGTGKTTVIRELVYQQFELCPTSKVLIVSQSNAAVDNALLGLVKDFGSMIIRCGSDNKIQQELLPYSIETKFNLYMERLNVKNTRLQSDILQDWIDTIEMDEENNSKLIRELLVRDHRIVGATCLGLMKREISLNKIKFDLVIFDEAGKALPAELVIPSLCAKKIIFIGDQNQLPPVIDRRLFDTEYEYSREKVVVNDNLFSESLFERIISALPQTNKAILNIQYRMPSVIGSMVSKLFYNNKLINGDGTDSKKGILNSENLSFYDFEDVKQYRESEKEGTVVNESEAVFVVAMVHRIRQKNPNCTIAIITPYRGQKRLIMEKMSLADELLKIDTVDGFQGQEADIVIFCSTRSSKRTLFFQDWRRINVAMSRTKRELIILGKLSYFMKYSDKTSCLPELAQMIKCEAESGKAKIYNVHGKK